MTFYSKRKHKVGRKNLHNKKHQDTGEEQGQEEQAGEEDVIKSKYRKKKETTSKQTSRKEGWQKKRIGERKRERQRFDNSIWLSEEQIHNRNPNDTKFQKKRSYAASTKKIHKKSSMYVDIPRIEIASIVVLGGGSVRRDE